MGKPPEKIDFDDLKYNLEELISLTAQTADKSTVNLTTKFESFEQQQQAKEDNRWAWFKWCIGGVASILTLTIPLLFLSFERIHNQITTLSERQSIIEAHDKEQPSFTNLEKIIKELEKTDTRLEERLNHCVSQKDLAEVKKEIMNWLLQLFKEKKYEKDFDSGK